MQHIYCSYPRQVDQQVLPWGASCIRVIMGVGTLSISLTRCFGGFHPCSLHLDFCYVLVDFTHVDPYICWYQNAQITITGTEQHISGTGFIPGTGRPILGNSLVPTCLTLLTSF